jgi:hypothetical protein
MSRHRLRPESQKARRKLAAGLQLDEPHTHLYLCRHHQIKLIIIIITFITH